MAAPGSVLRSPSNDNGHTPRLAAVPAPPRREWTTPAEDAAKIRAELKRRGWSSRDVSVRARSYSMGSSIDVCIRRAGLPFAEVEELARDVAERISRDHLTGEILSGGNRFVSVTVAHEPVAAIAAVLAPRLASWPVGAGGRRFVAGVSIEHHCNHSNGFRAYYRDDTGRDTLRDLYDAGAAAHFVAEHLFRRYADALAIARAVAS